MAVVGAGVAGVSAVFAAATASFLTAALATAVSVLGVNTVLLCFCWYYSSAAIVAGLEFASYSYAIVTLAYLTIK